MKTWVVQTLIFVSFTSVASPSWGTLTQIAPLCVDTLPIVQAGTAVTFIGVIVTLGSTPSFST